MNKKKVYAIWFLIPSMICFTVLFISVDESAASGIRLILIEDRAAAMADMPNGWVMALVIAAGSLAVALLFIIFMADRLTRPLGELRAKMEETDWSNLTREVQVKSSDADIRALTTAYQELMQRLSRSRDEEKKLNLLQLQAQFDTLQAQINPHFLYNVLNVISSRGMEDDDEVICEMCGQLANMLRYSTNTKTRYASIEKEVEYTRQYLYLIKMRYEDSIDLEVQVDPEILAQMIPKTVLQQLVENSVSHGFEHNADKMRVTVKGSRQGDRWYLTVRDNGQGISPYILEDLNRKLAKTKKSLLESQSNVELEIGGMGLVNAYARLLLIYSDSLIFEMKNVSDGAQVTIGGKMS